ncbi:hypothetical protein AAMO2058_000306800 [Amorphochlora amoebiformis]
MNVLKKRQRCPLEEIDVTNIFGLMTLSNKPPKRRRRTLVKENYDEKQERRKTVGLKRRLITRLLSATRKRKNPEHRIEKEDRKRAFTIPLLHYAIRDVVLHNVLCFFNEKDLASLGAVAKDLNKILSPILFHRYVQAHTKSSAMEDDSEATTPTQAGDPYYQREVSMEPHSRWEWREPMDTQIENGENGEDRTYRSRRLAIRTRIEVRAGLFALSPLDYVENQAGDSGSSGR